MERTKPEEATQIEELVEAERAHAADRPPTDEESRAADRDFEQSEDEERHRVAEHFHEMNEIGAHAQGEGSVE